MGKIILIIIALSISCSSIAQEPLSLLQAIQKALEHNYSIQIQKMDEQIATLNNDWGKAGKYPSVGLSVSSNNKLDANSREDFRQHNFIGGVNVNWILFNGFKVNITKQKLNELEDLSKGYSAIVVEGTIQSVVLAYYGLKLEQEKLKVYQQNVNLSKDRYDYDSMRKDMGTTVTYELLQSKNAFLADQSNVLFQETVVKQAQRTLSFLLGDNDFNLILIDELNFDNQDFQFEALHGKMVQNNKTLQNQYINQQLLQKDIELAKASYYPTISMNAGGQVSGLNSYYTTAPNSNETTSNIFTNFTLSYSLFDGGAKRRAKQIAAIQEQSGSMEIDELELSLSNELRNLLDFYNTRKSILELANERMAVSKMNLDISEQKLKAGLINSFNFRDVQLAYLNASIAQLNAVFNLIESNMGLSRITGGLIDEF